mgnify:CR=1 FL=1
MPRCFSVFWHQRRLIRQLTVRNLQSEVKGSLLGLCWLIVNPLLMLAVYAFVFGGIFGARFEAGSASGAQDYVLGLFLGLSIHQLLASVLMTAPRLIHQHPGYVKKFVFPLEVLPIGNVCAAAVRFATSLLLLLAALLLLGNTPGWVSLYALLSMAPVLPMALGLAYLMAGMGVFFRDLPQMSNFFSIIMLYASGVFYAAETVQVETPAIWAWLQWNPVLHAIDLSRQALLWHTPPDLPALSYLWLCGLALYFLGYTVFSRVRPAFADIV